MLMVGAKLTVIQVPFLFKHAIDGLALDPSAAALLPDGVPLVVLTPPLLMVAYGAARAAAEGMAQLRSSLFASVTEAAAQRTAVNTFRHLHAMDLSFHLSRQTGALSRTVERGTKAVGVLLSTTVLHVLPTAFEVSVVSALLYRNCGGAFAATTLATLALYSAFTFGVTRWRTQIRRDQNRAETAAAQSFVDSLINFETVKYFDATAHEERRYDASLSHVPPGGAQDGRRSPGLNFGQSVIFSGGLAVSMMLVLAAQVAAGRHDDDRRRRDGATGSSSRCPAALHPLGMVYNQVRQSSTDMAALLKLLGETPPRSSPPGAPPLAAAGGSLRFDGVHFGLRGRRAAAAQGACRSTCRRARRSRSSAVAARASRRSCGCSTASTTRGRPRAHRRPGHAARRTSRRCGRRGWCRRTSCSSTSRCCTTCGTAARRRRSTRRRRRRGARGPRDRGMPKGYDTVVGERGLKLSAARSSGSRSRARAAQEGADPPLRRGDVGGRHGDRARDLHPPARRDARRAADVRDDRPPPLDRRRRRPHHRVEQGRARRERHARRAPPARRRVRATWALQQGEGGPDWTGTTSSLPL